MPSPEVRKQPCQQNRTEYAGIDLFPDKRKPFIDFIEGLGLKQPKNFIPGNEATIYLLEKNSALLPGKLRFRIYGLPPFTDNHFIIDPDQEGVFEMKMKPHNTPHRIEIKHRQTSTAEAIDRFIKNPRAYKEIFSQESLFKNPFLPEGQIDDLLFQALLNSLGESGSIFPSLIIARNRQHWVLDENDSDTFRVTLDDGIKYFGYPYNQPTESVFTPPHIFS